MLLHIISYTDDIRSGGAGLGITARRLVTHQGPGGPCCDSAVYPIDHYALI